MTTIISIDGVGACELAVDVAYRAGEAADRRELGHSRGTPGCSAEVDIRTVRCLSIQSSKLQVWFRREPQQRIIGELILALAMRDQSVYEALERRCLASITSEVCN